MKKINIEYLDEAFEVRLTRIKAFPYDVFKFDFEDSPQLTKIMESPVYIVEMPSKMSFPEHKNTEQIDLLMSFALGIEENYSIINK